MMRPVINLKYGAHENIGNYRCLSTSIFCLTETASLHWYVWSGVIQYSLV